ncbi:MAG: YifB family Mg chelatase-like AAA ATPase [Rhodocyclaceae bacterium]|nr:YifB family Mg chelatase-like AAA ATPase [Rhodocyclaceae bacterium]MBX3668245.1 YifB family Mg chelatase-like AAA ATPase [Rhodocyclaceae bacterium]
MSIAILKSRALSGMDAPEIAVEVHIAKGLPSVTVVGLPETEVKEARERVRAAIQTAQFEFPRKRVTINLAPADLPKESGRYDLPIALGILLASGQLKAPDVDAYEFAGELSLTGTLRDICGGLPMALQTARAGRSLILPGGSAQEAALAPGTRVLPAASLLDVYAHLSGTGTLQPAPPPERGAGENLPDLSDVKGQLGARRALEIAAAGGHSLLLIGPPGTGKSMLAARLPGILPPLSEADALESAAVLSLAGEFRPQRYGLVVFRAPHHGASAAAIVGGGTIPRPGEISLAHLGVLFLDELPEFDRKVLESLREPMETGSVTISRAARRAEFPARFQLIAAMNPCPCGYFGHPGGRCRCTPDQITRYRMRLSGPVLDRFDMAVEVPALGEGELQAAGGEASASVRARVLAAHSCQRARQQKPNARLSVPEIDSLCQPDAAGADLLRKALARFDLSARAYHRVLRVARSIADCAGADAIGASHIAEAVRYRRPLGPPSS